MVCLDTSVGQPDIDRIAKNPDTETYGEPSGNIAVGVGLTKKDEVRSISFHLLGEGGG
jgi:hypothetical protein